MNIRVKRVYDSPAAEDGYRVLVDRVWPRGLSREKAAVHEWLREIAPSSELRRWFGHQVDRWPEFQARYREELREKEPLLGVLRERAARENLTLLYAARDREHNNAVVLRQACEEGKTPDPESI